VQQVVVNVAEGKRWVVDLDLEKFFDRVNHNILMARLARRIKDQRVLRLIRRHLQAGMMESGLVSPRTEETPQGGPRSPFRRNWKGAVIVSAGMPMIVTHGKFLAR
jgi:RNA-directed DNA polymerase